MHKISAGVSSPTKAELAHPDPSLISPIRLLRIPQPFEAVRTKEGTHA